MMRVLIALLPLATGTGAAVALGRALPPPRGLPQLLGWWLLVLSASVAVMLLTERAARRLMPLAMLLRLALRFPGPAPSRLRLTVRVGSARRLSKHLEAVERASTSDDAGRAAVHVLVLLAALAAHDSRTRGHAERVRMFVELLSEELRIPDEDRDRLRWAALLHDVGKLAVPGHVLTKADGLDEDEWVLVQRHPAVGATLCAPLLGWLGEWGSAIAEHHERWDGRGYPRGLAGTEIGYGARIVAVADAYEVMTAPRPYQRPRSPAAAAAELAEQAGRQFDPAVVRAFLALSVPRLRWVIGPLAALAQLPLLRLGRLTEPGNAAASAGLAASLAVTGVAGGLGPAVRLTPPAPAASAAESSVSAGVDEADRSAAPQGRPAPSASLGDQSPLSSPPLPASELPASEPPQSPGGPAVDGPGGGPPGAGPGVGSGPVDADRPAQSAGDPDPPSPTPAPQPPPAQPPASAVPPPPTQAPPPPPQAPPPPQGPPAEEPPPEEPPAEEPPAEEPPAEEPPADEPPAEEPPAEEPPAPAPPEDSPPPGRSADNPPEGPPPSPNPEPPEERPPSGPPPDPRPPGNRDDPGPPAPS